MKTECQDLSLTLLAFTASGYTTYFLVGKARKVFDIYGDTTIHAAFCMTKGQRISLETKWLPDTLQKNRQLKLVRLGARTAGSSFYNSYYSIKAARFLSPGHLLKTDDLRLDDHDNSLLRSPLDLPVPLVGEGAQLRLTTTLIPGESIKSSMLQLPTTEAELAKFCKCVILLSPQQDQICGNHVWYRRQSGPILQLFKGSPRLDLIVTSV
ncbi:MAG: hypothetical protein IPO31_23520 [Candidatus Obscuribacter sp.]|nr:hypothetical protein [Candidatus Obscuribacter sp.]